MATLFAAGSAVGTKMAGEQDFGVGESKEARQLVEAAGLEDPLVENILVSSGSAETTSATVAQIVDGTRALDETGPVRGPEQAPELAADSGRIA